MAITITSAGWLDSSGRPRESASRSCRSISAARNASVHVSLQPDQHHSILAHSIARRLRRRIVTTAEGPAVIADHSFVTGHIPRATFERVLSPTRMKVGIDNGLGCFPDKMPV